MNIFAPPAGFSSTKLAAFAALGFVLAAVVVVPTLDRDAGIPELTGLLEANGQVVSVHSHKYGVKFRLRGRAETFDYPSKARGTRVVESALANAGKGEVELLFNPTPRTPLFRSDAYYDVWQISISGKSIRAVAESAEGWRADNAVVKWLFAALLLISVYLSLLARRAYVHERNWNATIF